jgi:hypothetical protein
VQAVKRGVSSAEPQTPEPETALHIPAWRQHLIDKGFVYEDGKRVKGKLDDVAYELAIFTRNPVTSQFLEENFSQRNGKKYSPNTCDKARDYANTKPEKN